MPAVSDTAVGGTATSAGKELRYPRPPSMPYPYAQVQLQFTLVI
jgi:hypothetical protein